MGEKYIHPTAIVETTQIGTDTTIWAYTHLMKAVQVGKNCNIGDHCFIEAGVVVGDNVTIKNGNMLFEGIRIEDGVFIGPHVFFTNDIYPRSPRLPQARKRYAQKEWLELTLIKHGASLGAGSIILGGITIGEFAMVGAGAVVTKNIPPYSLVIGNPARSVGWVCQCGQKLKVENKIYKCDFCDRTYKKVGKKIKVK